MLPSGEFRIDPRVGTPQTLAAAFASFTEVAGSLEKSYGNLQNEVAGLRIELDRARVQVAAERENARRAQALAEVAALLAHEIRNPLGSLELFAGLLAEDAALCEDSLRIVGHVQAGLRTLSATVNNVLQFHGANSGSLVPTNISNLVRLTLEFLKPVADQSSIELEFEDQLGEVSMAADPHALQQVFLNLALNSFRMMTGGGRFRIATCLEERNLQIRVSDTGPGISSSQKERVFEAGFTTRPGSPGLGLAVCKKIVEQHGGTIQAADATAGAEFVLTFRL